MANDSKLEKAYKDWKMQMWLGQQSYERGKYVVAQQKFKKALKDLDLAMISDERLAITLNNLALCYCAQGKHQDADPLYQRALSIDQSSGGANKLMLADDFSNIATHYRKQGMNVQAETLYQKALALWEEELGEHSAEVAGCLSNLGVLFCEKGECAAAIKYFKKALSIKGSIYGSKSKEYAWTLVNLATTYCGLNKCEEADPLFEEGVRVLEYTMDPIHPELIEAMENYLRHLKKVGNMEKARQVMSDIKRFKMRDTKTYY